jgi:endonuclease YncB( thermonuclease family)
MQFLRVLSLAGLAAIAAPQHTSGPEVVAVRSVVDGNTIDVANYGRLRLAGIRAPRLGRRGAGSEPFADEARRRLEGLVGRRYVRLEFPSARSSAYVLLDDGTCVNAVLAGDGLARVSERPGGTRGEELLRAQARAQSARLGIWSARDSTTPQLHDSAAPK